MIIDFHTHTFPDKIALRAVDSLKQKSHSQPFSDGTQGALAAQLKTAGVDHAVVLPVATNPNKCASINDASLALCSPKLTYFACIHPDAPDWKEELVRAKSLGFQGVKIHPVYQDVNIDDPRFVRILETCGELGLIVVMHAGADIGYPGIVRCHPKQIANALKLAGPVTLVAAHMGGWRNWEEVPEYLLGTSVYIDTAFSLGEIAPLDDYYKKEELPLLSEERFCNLIRLFGSDRVLFGTDNPWAFVPDCVRQIQALPLTETEKADILGNNAAKLLHLK